MSELTESSLRRMRRYLEECQAEYLFMGTLTVGGSWSDDPADFRRAVDRWLTWFLRRQRQLAGDERDRCSIFWFVEFQQRGAPHLHLFYTHRVPWQQSARKWADLCFENGLAEGDVEKFARTSTKFETLRCGWRGTMSYATKYATKSQQKEVPEGSTWNGRFWGVRGLRARGSCHAVGGYQPGAPVPSELMRSLDKAVESGVLRKFAWERGEGAVYFLRDGLRWRDVPELAAEVERWMCRLIDWGARDASGMHQPPE